MGCAPMAYLLWGEVMAYSSKDPSWINRDRFVLSNGHACALQYAMLHLTGYSLSLEDLAQFRKVGSKTPGHPESFVTEGVEVCTGPLGQGICNAVGMAIAETNLAANYNEAEFSVFDHYTYVLCGDGCLQEGVSGEACSLAGHLGLGKLIVLYDDNNITIDGETELSFTEDVGKRYESYGWQVLSVDDVSKSLDDLRAAIKAAKEEKDKPTIIKIKTLIGYGSPSKQGSEAAHGAPLGVDELAATKKFYGLPEDKSFYVPDEVKEFFSKASQAGDGKRVAWDSMFAEYTKAYPSKAAELSRCFAKQMPENAFDVLPTFTVGTDKDLATRKFSQGCLNAIVPKFPELIGGSADLTPSNCTRTKGAVDYQKDSRAGKYIRFGVREHGMAAICNGIFAHGGLRPFCSTFLVFAGYCLGSIRLSALSRFGVIYIFTHDSIGLGEDGPTHQPVETLETLRCIPNLYVLRPADSDEMSAAYKVALSHPETPSVICCSRQTLPGLEGSGIEKACKGGYVVVEVENPALILIGTGSEVGLCVEAAGNLTAQGIATRVVSMPCQELFLEQSIEYQRSVLPGNIPTLSVEASAVHGWHRFSHAQIGMIRFGASGNGKELLKMFGFTVENVESKGKEMVEFYKQAGSVPDLMSRPMFKMTNGAH